MGNQGNSSNNKNIAKNTILLYFRMLFLMFIGLITVRVTLQALGELNYGIYNVVGSAVITLSFLMGTLTSATQRYFAFHLGKKDIEGYRNTFSMFIYCFAVLCLGVIFLGETVGLNCISLLNIPHGSMQSAKFVYQTALFTFVINLFVVPYTSSIIAYERMSVFAYISIIDGIAKLGLVYLLYLTEENKLEFYGFLILIESALNAALYILFCHSKLSGCNIRRFWNKLAFYELFSYTGWNLFGSISGMLSTAGQNLLLNIFFGPLINTAKSIADKVSSMVESFSTNFYLAVTPQIIKSYASKEMDRLFSLVVMSSKFSFYLLLIFSFPLILCIKSLLTIWLGEDSISPDMIIFSKLALVYCLIHCLELPITQLIRATGKIKNYQIFVGIITLSFIPISAILLKCGAPAYSTMIVLIIIVALAQIIRVVIAHRRVDLSYRYYIGNTIIPLIYVTVSLIPIYFLLNNIPDDKFIQLIAKLLISLAITMTVILFIGANQNERSYIKDVILAKLRKG
ncbi:MAG: hypothetical protein NC098_05970 [Lachnoclostridium sp.]|nr:hypothetical protein [Lachnoclostridium sp.]